MEHDLYDMISKTKISGTNAKIGRFYKKDPSGISTLRSSKCASMLCRLVVLRDYDKHVFVLERIQDGEEFPCCTNYSIFLHLGIPYCENDSKYVGELTRKRQKTARINGEYFRLKYDRGEKKPEPPILEIKSLYGRSLREAETQRQFTKKLRAVIHAVINRQKAGEERFLALVGCDSNYFFTHIESQFTEGMTWERYGSEPDDWQVDHIIPCNTFDLSDPEQQKGCFHYRNLRPLWAEDNKGRPKNGQDVFGYGLYI